MKTWKKIGLTVLLIPILLMIVGVIAYAVHRAGLTPDERAAEDQEFAQQRKENQRKQEQKEAAQRAKEDELKDKEKQDVAAKRANDLQATESFIRQLAAQRQKLPRPAALAEKPCPPSLKDVEVKYLPADYAFFTQFGEAGFKPLADKASPWYRGVSLDEAEKVMTAGTSQADWDHAALARIAAHLASRSYLAVFVPLEQTWPSLDPGGKSYVGGHFRGWVILVDARTQEPLCQTQFTAHSSSKVTDHYLAIGPRDPEHSLKIGANMKKTIEDDFRKNFWDAANRAVGAMR